MAEEILLTKKTVKEVIHHPWTHGSGDEVFTILARVDNIYPDCGWCYVTCNECAKHLVIKNGLYYCNICNSSSRYPIIRYRIHLNVSDESGDVIFTLFNKQAEKLLLATAIKLAKTSGVASPRIPKEIGNLVDKSFAFQIKLPDYFNPDFDFHHHRVVALLEIQQVPSFTICRMLKEQYLAGKNNQDAPTETWIPDDDCPYKPAASVDTAFSVRQLGTMAEVSSAEVKIKSAKADQ